MTTRKRTNEIIERTEVAQREFDAKASPAPIGEHGPEIRSATGVELIDGAPFFAEQDGVRMNRRQWLEATKQDRKAAFIEALTAPADEEADQ